MPSKKFKIYTHHFTYTEEVFGGAPSARISFLMLRTLPLRLLLSLCYGFGIFVVRTAGFVLSLFTKLSFLIGLALVYPFIFIFANAGEIQTGLKGRMAATVDSIRERVERLRNPRAAYTLLVFFILCATVMGSFNAATLVSKAQNLKGRVLGFTTTALTNLETGKRLLESQQASAAAKAFDKAVFEFSRSKQEVADAGVLLGAILSVVPSKQDADELLEAGELLSSAAIHLTRVYELGGSLRAGQDGIVSSNSLRIDLPNIRTGLVVATQKIVAAYKHLEKVNPNSVPAENRQHFMESRELVSQSVQGLTVLTELVNLGVTLFAESRHAVVFFQNNNELRSTGGFLGSFADFTLSGGAIKNLRVSSIYDLDGQLQERILPPLPLFMVNDHLFLRDSNWFVDFPASAELMSDLYQKSTGTRPDIVAAITPNTIIDILKVTGPIYMAGYDVTLDADNFVERTQLETSIEYDKLENKPKKILSDLLPVLIGKIRSLPTDRLFLAITAIQKNLAQGGMIFYARDSGLQEQFRAFDWAGEVARTDRDFLLISKSNLGGTKTDTYIQERVELESAIDTNGDTVNTLRIVRANPLPPISAMINTSFIRILVPEGATLISNNGFSPQPFVIDFTPKGESYPAILEWEKKSVKDLTTGMFIGKEAGKTFFGNWARLPGGETQTLEVVYRLPFRLKPLDHISLLVQKQPGSNPAVLKYTVSFPGRIVHWKSSSLFLGARDALTLEAPVTNAQFFGAVLEE